jgi:hypothetical protein
MYSTYNINISSPYQPSSKNSLNLSVEVFDGTIEKERSLMKKVLLEIFIDHQEMYIDTDNYNLDITDIKVEIDFQRLYLLRLLFAQPNLFKEIKEEILIEIQSNCYLPILLPNMDSKSFIDFCQYLAVDIRDINDYIYEDDEFYLEDQWKLFILNY